MNTRTFIVSGSEGDFEVSIKGGEIIDRETEVKDYQRIKRFDVYEFKKHYNYSFDGYWPESVDILDIGYWYGEGHSYEAPESDWRNEVTLRRFNTLVEAYSGNGNRLIAKQISYGFTKSMQKQFWEWFKSEYDDEKLEALLTKIIPKGNL